MTMSPTLRKFLADHSIAYEVVSHRPTTSSLNSATAAHVPGNSLAKPVILEDAEGYLMAVIPANEHIKIGRLNHMLNRHMGLATETELRELFTDCELGAIPPVGQAFGMQTVVDDSLMECHDVYLESGDHTCLIHIPGSSFRRLMRSAPHASLCAH